MATVEDCLALMDAAKAGGMGPGRIALSLRVREAHPIRDVGMFLLRVDALLNSMTADTVRDLRGMKRRDLAWCLERCDRIDHEDGSFDLRFQFQGVTNPWFSDVADGIAELYAALVRKFNEPRQAVMALEESNAD